MLLTFCYEIVIQTEEGANIPLATEYSAWNRYMIWLSPLIAIYYEFPCGKCSFLGLNEAGCVCLHIASEQSIVGHN